ncbi:hypothetical protein [Rhodoligotrophos ferricapiens]|uniref:hypothetical protein n=1 Tax=Rhodoligotrophos ferricapiens TaxID=3069264 RepID=UPI00315DF492
MVLDADDWVDQRLVEVTRATMTLDHAVGIIQAGFAVDIRNLYAAPLPHPRIFPEPFHRICGSSAIFWLRPNEPDPLRRDPYQRLHEHYRLNEAAAEAQLGVTGLPVSGGYIVNTDDSHSETYGPYAQWRRRFNQAVQAIGEPIDERFAARFGLSLAQLHSDCGGRAGRYEGALPMSSPAE